MGYNGPAPGIHIDENGVPVWTTIVDSKAKIPALGDPYPHDPRWLADKPTRIEQIRPDAWSVDIPYRWALDWKPPRTTIRSYILAPRRKWWLTALTVAWCAFCAYVGYRLVVN